jgi:RNA recognition motif-containing protein
MESLEKSLVSPKHQLDGRTVEVKRAIPRGEVKTKSRKVFVGGVPPNATNESLRECFSKYGPIAEAQIMKDRVRGRSRGFGFVTFEDDESVPKVLSVSEHRLDGKLVDVKKAEPKKANVPTLAVGQAVAHLHPSPNSSPRGSLAFAPVMNPYVPAFTFVPYQVMNSEGFGSLGFTTPGYADANYLFHSPYTSPRGSFTVGENDLPQDFEILSMGRRFSHEFSGLSINPTSSMPQSLLSPVQAPLPIGQQHIPASYQATATSQDVPPLTTHAAAASPSHAATASKSPLPASHPGGYSY